MNYTKLGNTGLDVSPICLGCMSFGTAEGWVHNPWALNEEDSRTIIKRALELDVNFFDTANVYDRGASVTFEQGARTAWHTHSLCQIIIVTTGCDRAQRWSVSHQRISIGIARLPGQ